MGREIRNNKSDVVRFLSQAVLGYDGQLVENVARRGIHNWLEKEMSQKVINRSTYRQLTKQIWDYFRTELVAEHGEAAINGDGNNPALPYKWYFHMAWWHRTLTSRNHLIRQRVALALSELLVISDKSSLELDAVGMADYYDLLYHHAFGNYADLLTDVSLHPCMGVYLSHMNNRKADPGRNIHPDENYAREIMQLFTIGLFELNGDGSEMLDGEGKPIPTYDNRDIKELARVFTGLQPPFYQYEWSTGFWDPSYNNYPVDFEDGVEKAFKTVPFVNMTNPMKGNEQYHDRGAKNLLGGKLVLPGGQNVQDEVKSVVAQLVAHSNTAPFVAKHLIRQLVCSNPAPAYVEAVANAFGSVGDLGAAVYEVLSYPLDNSNVNNVVQSSGSEVSGPTRPAGKMKSPLLRATQVLRMFKASNDSGKAWVTGEYMDESLRQHPLSSPTVFNFYSPDYTPHGPIEEAGLVAPEFELHTSATAIDYVNLMYYWFFADRLPAVSTIISGDPDYINVPELDPDVLITYPKDRLTFDFMPELKMAGDPRKHDALIDHMSLLMTGKTGLPFKDDIKASFKKYADNPLWVVQTIAFMISISPEFVIQEV